MNALLPYIPIAVVIAAWIGAALFYRRRLTKLEEAVVADDSRPEGHLTLIRKIDATNFARKFKILIDGEVVGPIAAGETRHIKVAAGRHDVAVQVDWCKTDPVLVDIDDSRNAALTCGSTHNDWKCLFMAFVDPKNYLYVRVTHQ